MSDPRQQPEWQNAIHFGSERCVTTGRYNCRDCVPHLRAELQRVMQGYAQRQPSADQQRIALLEEANARLRRKLDAVERAIATLDDDKRDAENA